MLRHLLHRDGQDILRTVLLQPLLDPAARRPHAVARVLVGEAGTRTPWPPEPSSLTTPGATRPHVGPTSFPSPASAFHAIGLSAPTGGSTTERNGYLCRT